MQQLMRCYRPAYLLAVRFMPGLRTALLFVAGLLKTPYRQLPIYDGAVALIELPVLVYGVHYLRGQLEAIVGLVQRFQGVLVPGAILRALVAGLYSRSRANNNKS